MQTSLPEMYNTKIKNTGEIIVTTGNLSNVNTVETSELPPIMTIGIE